MIHSYDSQVAVQIGVKGAVLLNHLHWWVEKNRANEMNYHDGCYWTYNSAKAYGVLFPYWTQKTIQRELLKLEQDGYIKTGCYNDIPTKRTKWYTLTNKGYALINKEQDNLSQSIRQKCPMDWTEMSNGEDRNDQSSYNSNKTHSIKHSNNARPREGDCSPELAETLTAFAEHRKKLKRPMTDYAKNRILKRLKKMARTEEEQIAMLNQSIENGWVGVFPLGGTGNGRGRKSSSDMADAVKQKLRDGGLLHDGAGEESGGGHADGSPSWFSEF